MGKVIFDKQDNKEKCSEHIKHPSPTCKICKICMEANSRMTEIKSELKELGLDDVIDILNGKLK